MSVAVSVADPSQLVSTEAILAHCMVSARCVGAILEPPGHTLRSGRDRRARSVAGCSTEPFYGLQLVRWREVCVTHRHLNLFVSHQRSNRRYVDTGHYEATSERVTQIVPGEVLNASFLVGVLEPMPG